MNFHRSRILFSLLLLCGQVAAPAMADKWPSETPGFGGAVAAKVIAQQCLGVLTTSDIVALDAYIAKAAGELASKPEAEKKRVGSLAFHDVLIRNLTATYTSKYSDPLACDAAAAEQARDVLQKVRRALATGKPLYPDENDPDHKLDVGEVIFAKVRGENCPGTLTALELTGLELYIVKTWVRVAQRLPDKEARAMIQLYKSSEAAMTSEWRPSDCTPEVVAKTKRIAALAQFAKLGDSL